ncbi:MAG: signal transduction histidine kinase [Saprospiraceae bacterium]|jgi:signal transduction histidine kinase
MKYVNLLPSFLVRIAIFFAVFLLNDTPILGNDTVVDSLINELKQAKEDTLIVKLFLDISWEYHNSKPQQTIEYGQRAFDLSMVINYKKGACSSLNHIGIGYDIQGDLEKAMGYYQSALNAAEEMKDDKLIRNYLNNVGLIHQRRGNYNKAMDCFHKALTMVDEEKENQKGTASVLLNNIGLIHSSEERYKKALEYFERSLSIERVLANSLGISMALTNIGEQHKHLGKKAKALICYKEALAISESIDDKVGVAILLTNIGDVHLENGFFDLAEEFYPKAFEVANEVGDKGTISNVLNRIAKLKQQQKQYQSAIRYSQQGLLLAREMGDKKGVTDIFKTLTESYVAIQDFEKAYEYQTLFNQAKDSLFSTEKSKQIMEVSTQYETQRKETENQLLKEQQAKSEAVIKQRTIIGFAVAVTLILMSIIAFILFSLNRQKNRYSQRLEDEVTNRTSDLEETNVKLRESNRELERFAYIASHDLKEPLRNIMSFTKLIERRLPQEVKLDKNIEEYMSYIVNNTNQMHQLIEDVLEYSRIDNTKPLSETIEVKDVVSSVSNVLNSTLKEQNVILNIGDLPRVKANASQLFLVLKNLIENGVKYNKSQHPLISIYSIQKNGLHEITVADNGIGIEEQYNNRIFGMFKRLHNREEYQGSGLGLSICKKIIQNLGGDIWVESTYGEGSKFIFTLPVYQEAELAENQNTTYIDRESVTLN